MKQIRMRFKGFEFPANPSVIEVKHSRNINESPLFESDSFVSNVSKNASVVKGEGSFFGENAFEYASELEALNKSEADGWLFLPDGNCLKAFFKELTVKADAKRNEVFYTFCFVESCSHKRDELALDFVIAREDENLFDIAYRCKTPLESIMELNEFKNPFDVSAGDRVVLR